MSRGYRVTVVCTDRGQHPVRKVGWLTDLTSAVLFTRWITARELADGVPADPQIPSEGKRVHPVTLVLPCRTCRRNVELRQDRARRMLDALESADVRDLDISVL